MSIRLLEPTRHEGSLFNNFCLLICPRIGVGTIRYTLKGNHAEAPTERSPVLRASPAIRKVYVWLATGVFAMGLLSIVVAVYTHRFIARYIGEAEEQSNEVSAQLAGQVIRARVDSFDTLVRSLAASTQFSAPTDQSLDGA